MKSYAQNGEDLILWKYFQDQGIEEGTFLDVGANDGVTLSNTYLFISGFSTVAGSFWNGYWVEPNKKAFLELVKNVTFADSDDPIQRLHNVAIAPTKGYQTLHASGEHLGKGDTGLLSTLIPSEMDRWKGTETFTEETVRTCRIEDLGIEGPVNLISIDCEGMDFEVLTQCPLEEWKTKAVCIEWNGVVNTKALIYGNLKQWGFRLHHETHENLIFVK